MAYDLADKPSGQHWVTAVFESHSAAQKAKDDLIAVGIPAIDIEIRSAAAHAAATSQSGHDPNILKALLDIFIFMPSEDRLTLDEALQRGGVALAVRTSPEQYEQAIDVLDRDGSIDLDDRRAPAMPKKAADSSRGDAKAIPVEQSHDPLQNPSANPDMRERIGVGTSDMTAGMDISPPNAASPSVRDMSHGRQRVRSYLVNSQA